MKKEEKVTAIIGLIVIIAICLMLIAVAFTYINKNGGFGVGEKELPESAAFSYLNGFNSNAVFTDGSRLYFEDEPQSEEALKIYNMLKGNMKIDITESKEDKREATVSVNLTCPYLEGYKTILKTKVNSYLENTAKNAVRRSDVYNEDDTYREDVLQAAYENALETEIEEIPTMTVAAELRLKYSAGAWQVENGTDAENKMDEIASSIRSEVISSAILYPVAYKIEESALKGSTPDPDAWGETDDPNVVMELVATEKAKSLIGDEKLVFSPDIEFKGGTLIRYYLDETILMIEWQETEAKTVGTFSEVFIADGSQLRRKIGGDTYGDMNFETTTDYAKDTNAILCVGGDFYNHARNCGIVVLNRQIYRFDQTCDMCYITGDGDMLFSYRYQFSDISEAQKFIEDNDILFSLSFGPVLVDNGVDVTPTDYPYGEINDTYARSALGMLGKHHYLTLNMNCELPHHWFLATLRSAADAMIKRGCIKAYALDGGQTATTVVNGKLINPVQFGEQRLISDVIYFCSAVPRE